MQDLRDATTLLGDPEGLQQRLRTHGYLYFPGLLDPAPLRALRSEILTTIAAHGWLADGTDPDDAVPSEPRSHGTPEFRDGYIAIQRLESFHRAAFDESLHGVLRSLLGDDVLVHVQRIARVIWPDLPTLTTAPHQDFTHIQGTPDVLTTWIPLADCPREAGGLRVLEGSTGKGIRPVRPSTGAGRVGIDIPDDDPAWRTADYRVGDVVLFHSLTVHGGLPNTSGRLRLSVDYRYQSAHDPVARQSIIPHNHPYVPDVEELWDGWSTRRWVELPDGLDVGKLQLPVKVEEWHEELTLPPSRFVPTPA